ncbi:hypothetical protein HYPSUDRAFT_362953 [Hypholoma sublateritium FD-334 SS-4]|uniref:Uncharacterized protein n=1 Tax=Hypholoma sublateritium (strain FD-334 SS-4) TaxID=945553 RepID=A0A0D2P587_HYPSF|nr:hypothetical protein HYPSUDRAFT_362953 [Hypholoma sublateritium FD-334 SS-4]
MQGASDAVAHHTEREGRSASECTYASRCTSGASDRYESVKAGEINGVAECTRIKDLPLTSSEQTHGLHRLVDTCRMLPSPRLVEDLAVDSCVSQTREGKTDVEWKGPLGRIYDREDSVKRLIGDIESAQDLSTTRPSPRIWIRRRDTSERKWLARDMAHTQCGTENVPLL